MARRTIHSREYEKLLDLLRKARGDRLTQVELAKRLGVTQSAVSKFELGERRMDVVQLRAWCQALKVSFVELVAEFDRQA